MQQLIMSRISSKEKFGFLPSRLQKHKQLVLTYVIFLVIYAAFLLIPRPPEVTLLRYHLSTLGVRFIYLTIILLLALIWAMGFYGYAKLHNYASLIRKQKDGRQVEILSRGVFLLVMWLPVSEVVTAILNFIAVRHPGFLGTDTIIHDYVNLLIPLAAFIIIGQGARGLSGLVKSRYTYAVSTLLSLIVVYAGITYVHLVASTTNLHQVYHMSLWMILLTIVAPYVYMWFTGAVAAYEIYNYQHRVTGVIYKRGWKLLAIGCGWLIVASMIFQYLTTLYARLTSLSIYWILAIIYSLLAVLSIGFILIALGAARLQKIEEL